MSPFTALILLASFEARAGMVVVGDLVRDATIGAGERSTGEILVRNTGDEPIDVLVHARDYTFSADGSNVFGEPGSTPRSNAAWVRFTPHQLRVAPRSQAPVAYEVVVPPDPSLAGTYWSVLVVEPMSGRFDAEAVEAGVGVRTVVRYAVHLATHVPGDATTDLALGDPLVRSEANHETLEFTVANQGERGARAAVWADVFDPRGVPLGRFRGEPVLTYPGCARRGRIDLPDLKPGGYTAILVADGGRDDVFGIQLALEVR